MILRILWLAVTAVFLLSACTPTTQIAQTEIPPTVDSPLMTETSMPADIATQTPLVAETPAVDTARPTPTNVSPVTLAALNGRWVLVSYGPAENQLLPVAEATAEFDNGNELHGTTGCNNYFTRYTLSAETLALEAVQMTRMACSATVQPQETAFVEALNQVKSIYMAGDNLVIVYAGGELRFAPRPAPAATPLDGTIWQLSLIETGTVSYSPSGVVTAVFANGQITGLGSCNRYGGSFTLDGANIQIQGVDITAADCLQTGLIEQEATYIAALTNVTSYVWEKSSLRLIHPAGVLHFTLMPPLSTSPFADTVWKLSSFNVDGSFKSPVAGSQITIQFRADQVSGSAGCNLYGGSYTLTGDTLQITATSTTLMACGEETMAQESSFLFDLTTPSLITVAVSDSQLILFIEGKIYLFVR